MSTFKVLAVGDSNTSGAYTGIAWSVWPTRLRSALAAALPGDTVTLTNNAVGGQCSGDLETNYATYIGDESPSLVVIVYGTNDAYYDDPLNGYPHGDGKDHSASAFQTRMTTIVNNALALTDASGRRSRVILCSPPPCSVQADGLTYWRDAVRLNAIRASAAAVATATGCTYVDLWTSMQVPASWKADYLLDGLHMTSAGQQAIADAVLTPALTALGVVSLTPATETDAAQPLTFSLRTAGLTLDPNPYWQQSGTALTVHATVGRRRETTGVVTSDTGGPCSFRGVDAADFEVSLNGTDWAPSVTVPAGDTPVWLSVEASVSGPVSAEFGVTT